MEILNKNIETALKNLEASEDNRSILKTILYKEHINRERDWGVDAPKEIREIIHNATNGGEND